MASLMHQAIAKVFIDKAKLALAAYFPASAPEGYFQNRLKGEPEAISGHWFCAVHEVTSRQQGTAHNNYGRDIWSAAMTITVRSSYAADDRFAKIPESTTLEYPIDFLRLLCRKNSIYFVDNSWAILADVNTYYAQASTNGLITPFTVTNPMDSISERGTDWLKAVRGKKTSQVEAISATIRLTGAEQIQVQGGMV